MLIERFEAAQLRLADLSAAHVKAAAIASGAALVTLGGIIGNVHDPNFAVRALAGPLALFAIALYIALLGMQEYALGAALQLGVAVQQAKLEHLRAAFSANRVDPFGPVDLSAARLIYGEEAEGKLREFLAARLKRGLDQADENLSEQEAAIAALERAYKDVNAQHVKVNNRFTASSACATAAAISLAWAGYIGIQPAEQVKKAPAAQTKVGSSPTLPSAPAPKSQLPQESPETPAPPPLTSGPPSAAAVPGGNRQGG